MWSGTRIASLHQKQYILNLVEKHGLQEAKVVSTPTDLSVKDDGVSKGVDSVTYQSIVGGLMYAATTTRPDILFAVGDNQGSIIIAISHD